MSTSGQKSKIFKKQVKVNTKRTSQKQKQKKGVKDNWPKGDWDLDDDGALDERDPNYDSTEEERWKDRKQKERQVVQNPSGFDFDSLSESESESSTFDLSSKSAATIHAGSGIMNSLPRVLLANCFSFLTGNDRQRASLVCRLWSVVEKDRFAWPSTLLLHQRRIETIALLTRRIKLKHFEHVGLVGKTKYRYQPLSEEHEYDWDSDTETPYVIDQEFDQAYHLACAALLKEIKTNSLMLSVLEPFKLLAEMTHVNELQYLNLAIVAKQEAKRQAKLIAKPPPMPALTKLTSEAVRQTDLEALVVACPALRHLEIGCQRISNLLCLERSRSLERLHLFCNLSCFMELCSHLHSMSSLKELKVQHNDSEYVLDAPALLLTSFRQIAESKIQVLSLQEFRQITDEHLSILSESKHITDLALVDCLEIKGTGFPSFPKISKLRSLCLDCEPDSLIAEHELTKELERELHLHYLSRDFQDSKEKQKCWWPRNILCKVIPLLEPEGFMGVCALSSLTSLRCNLGSSSDLDLTLFGKLTHLTSLDVSVCEDFDEMKWEPLWLTSLPLSLRSLCLDLGPRWRLRDGKCLTYRSYSQCLPYLARLSRVNSLELCLGGVVTAAELKHITHLPLRSLTLHWSPYAKHKGLKGGKPTIEAFKSFKSLKSLQISRSYMHTEECQYWCDHEKAPSPLEVQLKKALRGQVGYRCIKRDA